MYMVEVKNKMLLDLCMEGDDIVKRTNVDAECIKHRWSINDIYQIRFNDIDLYVY